MKKSLLFIFLLFSVSYVAIIAQTKSEQLKQNKKNLEKEINNTQALLDQTRKNKKASLQQIAILRSQINNREELIVSLNNEVLALEEEMELNIRQSKNLDRKLSYMKSDYSRAVYNAYKNRKHTSQMVFLLSSEDFGQMYRRLKFYTAFAKNVRHQVEQIQATQEEIAIKKAEIQQIKEEKLIVLSGEEQQLNHLEKEKREKDKLASDLKTKEKKLAAEIRQKQKEQKEIDKKIRQAIEREIAAANAKENKNSNKTNNPATSGKSSLTELRMTAEEQQLSNTFSSNKGKLPWPVTKCSVTTAFGTYHHPDVPSVEMQNNGINLLTEPNASVRAIFQGVVTAIIDYFGTKVLIIKHGEYSTVYQNLSSVNVKKGDKITTKQIIGKVAKNNSNSTYELHFELLKNTTHLNPALWLAK